MNKCDWCKAHKLAGKWRDGQWICASCFPLDAGLQSVRKCEYCNSKTNQGGVLLGKWICSNCANVFDTGKEKKKNKYPPRGNYDNPKKKKRKVKQEPKPKQITRWKVVIEDISNGKL